MYFLTTNQLFCFRFDIDKVIRQTDTYTCMHINIHIQRYTCILAYMHEFIHKNKPPIIPSTTDNGKMIFIHSGYFYSASKSTTAQRRSRPQQFTLCRGLHAEALQATVSERLAQGLWSGG